MALLKQEANEVENFVWNLDEQMFDLVLGRMETVFAGLVMGSSASI